MNDMAFLSHALPSAFLAHFACIVDPPQQLRLLQWAFVLALDSLVIDVSINPARCNIQVLEHAVLQWVAKRQQPDDDANIKAYLLRQNKYFPDPHQVYPAWWGNEDFVPGITTDNNPARMLLEKWRLSSALIDRAARDVVRKENKQLNERPAKVSWTPKRVVDEFTQTGIIPTPVHVTSAHQAIINGGLPHRATYSGIPTVMKTERSAALPPQKSRWSANSPTPEFSTTEKGTSKAFFADISLEPPSSANTQSASTTTSKKKMDVKRKEAEAKSVAYSIPQDSYTSPRLALREEKTKVMVDIAKRILEQDDFIHCFDLANEESTENAQERPLSSNSDQNPTHQLTKNDQNQLWFERKWLP